MLNNETLEDLYFNQGMTYEQIGELFGVTKQTIHMKCKSLGFLDRKREDFKHRDTVRLIKRMEGLKEQIVEDYQKKYFGMKEIEEKYDVSSSFIKRYFKIIGIPIRGWKDAGEKRRVSKEKRKVFIEKKDLYEKYCVKNTTISQIAREHNMPTSTVYRFLKQYDIPIKSKKLL